MTDNRIALVAGSGGVIGRSVIGHFVEQGIPTRGVSRRAPLTSEGWEHVRADLLDADSLGGALRPAADTTHLVFAAYIESADPKEQIATNVTLLRNTLNALATVDTALEHVTLYQGMKYYGAHLGKFKTPAREDDPRQTVPNFYYDQEDLLRRVAQERGFRFTILRPEAVMGYAQGTPMNLLMVIAAYVALTKKLGLPLRFPGPRETYDGIFYQMSDAELLARATDWAGTSPAAAGEAFNLTNGDVIRWSHLWAAIAAHYDLELAEPQRFSLADQMPLYESLWNEIVDEHGLESTPLSDLVDWRFGDAIFGSTWDNVSSTIKVRTAGFAESHDTITRTIELLDDLATKNIVPAARS